MRGGVSTADCPTYFSRLTKVDEKVAISIYMRLGTSKCFRRGRLTLLQWPIFSSLRGTRWANRFVERRIKIKNAFDSSLHLEWPFCNSTFLLTDWFRLLVIIKAKCNIKICDIYSSTKLVLESVEYISGQLVISRLERRRNKKRKRG